MKLTISIGTYNRPEYIQRQVRDVLNQIQEDVELFVFDNCSDLPVVSLFTPDELKQFTIIRNKINIGRDQNQVRSIETVTDGWVWTLSDDDEIKPNAIQTILDIIQSHQDYCFINFGNKKISDCQSFQDLTDYFAIVGAFGNSYFQSNCLYNVDRIKKSILWFNDFLSSQIGQICMVIKHMELNDTEKCLFLTDSLVSEVQPGGWSKKIFIINSSILIDKFHYNKKYLKANLFKGIGDMYCTMLCSCKLNFSEFIFYNSFLQKKFGFNNLIRYNLITYCGFIANQILPSRIFSRIRIFIAGKYNNKITK